MKTDRIPELDLLRFIAALAVVIFHLLREGPLAEAARYGFLGVPLFFLISGFVILWTASGRSASQFVATRLARLYPSFWICVALTATVLALRGNPPSGSMLAANLTMLPGPLGAPFLDNVYWTLYFEILFYGLIFLVLVTRQIQRIEWVLAAWLLCSTFGWPEKLTLGGNSPLFIGGCLLYLIRARGPSIFRLSALAWSAVLATISAIHQHPGFTHLSGTAPSVIVGSTVMGIHVLLLCIAVRLIRLPSSPTWYVLGSLTYPLYLLHNVIGATILHSLPPQFPFVMRLAVTLAIVLALTAIIAWGTERRICPWLQKRLLRLVDARVGKATDPARTGASPIPP